MGNEDEPLWTPPKIRANKFERTIAIKWAGHGGRWWVISPDDPEHGRWDDGPDTNFDRDEWIDPTVCPHEDIGGLTAAIRRHHSDIEQILKGFQRLPWG
ncbi:MAG TPA: hypothetical protein VFG35_00345 [Actinoplanes sp.]|nr:hypothetical protein [Actinoplanes sp.]